MIESTSRIQHLLNLMDLAREERAELDSMLMEERVCVSVKLVEKGGRLSVV
jgi:hypothetical protein